MRTNNPSNLFNQFVPILIWIFWIQICDFDVLIDLIFTYRITFLEFLILNFIRVILF